MPLRLRNQWLYFMDALRANRRPKPAFSGELETLEQRIYLTVNFFFDYSRDSNGFFDQQERREALDFAGNMLASRLNDSLLSINPGGSNNWEARFSNPSTGLSDKEINLNVPADTIYVFAGARNLSSAIATAGPGGFSASGTQAWLDRVNVRGQLGELATPPTDFGPWGGQLSLDLNRNWHFGLTTDTLTTGQTDFISVAVHELGHVLGIGTSSSWNAMIANSQFTGAATVDEFDGAGNPQLAGDLSHFAENTTDALNGSGMSAMEVSLDPSLTIGTRKLFTPLDFAALDDIGWEVINNSVFTIDVPNDGNGHTIVISDDGQSANNLMQFTIDGEQPTSFMLPTSQLIIQGGSSADQITLQSSDSGITAVATAVNGGGGNDLIQVDAAFTGTVVAHGDEGNDVIDATAATRSVTLDGGSGNDRLVGGSNNDVVQGALGNDTLTGGLGNDLLNGDLGNDRLDERFDGNLTLTDNSLTGLGNDQVGGFERARLTGGPSPNILSTLGFSGPSTLRGGANNDTLIGGDGNDKLDGGLGDDQLNGGDGDDRLVGKDGDDELTGSDGDDILNGNDGDDVLVEEHDGTLVLRSIRLAGKGTDRLSNIAFARLTGGDQNNVIDASDFDGSVTLFGNGGNDTLRGGARSDSIEGGTGADRIVGNTGDDILSGGLGADLLFGGSGDDILIGGFGNDVLNGQFGTDVLTESADIDMTLTNGQLAALGVDSFSNIELGQLTGGASANVIDASQSTIPVLLFGQGGADILSGGGLNDTIKGGDGNDRLEGNGGNDDLDGEAGNDELLGGPDDDVLRGSDGLDVINGQSGTDEVSEELDGNLTLTDAQLSGRGNDTLSNIERGRLVGGPSSNVLDATGFSQPVTLIGRGGNDTLRGTNASDTIDGGAGRDLLNGRGGDDQLFGGSNNDTLQGGTGDDELDGGRDDDFINGNGGVDVVTSSRTGNFSVTDLSLIGDGNDTLEKIEAARLSGSSADNTLNATGFSGSATMSGGGGNDEIIGGSGNDFLSGGENDDTIRGASGRDTIEGGPGNDSLEGDNGQDLIDGDEGDDTLKGQLGNDTLMGDVGDDGISGGTGKDRLIGNSGNDTLIGGAEDDTLLGGGGDDIALGGDDDDTIDAQGGSDTVAGNDGNDTILDQLAEIDESFSFSADWLDE
ncbi:MAG: hypothetical protein CMJ78_02560 [Planctomycetaceae bacterium]|nr:hypothetical protein [Planctomycetaceae bacterium]